MTIPTPFLQRKIGAGDLVKAALEKIGLPQNEGCPGCRRRQEKLNTAAQFVPKR